MVGGPTIDPLALVVTPLASFPGGCGVAWQGSTLPGALLEWSPQCLDWVRAAARTHNTARRHTRPCACLASAYTGGSGSGLPQGLEILDEGIAGSTGIVHRPIQSFQVGLHVCVRVHARCVNEHACVRSYADP